MIVPSLHDLSPLDVIIPFLRTFPSINVWQMGCPIPEEPYWTGLALRDELRERFRIYVTDPDELAIQLAIDFGSRPELSPLRERMAFFQWDSTTDGSFNEFQLVIARMPPTERGFTMIHASLCRLGVLDLAQGMTMAGNPFTGSYEPLAGTTRGYRRTR